jgi:hypothetical protein
MEFNIFERAVAGFFYDTLPIKGDLSFREYNLSGEGLYKAGFGMLGDDNDPIQVVFSIPKDSDDLYFIISDGNPDELAGEIASLQKYNEKIAHLCMNHTVPTECDYVKGSGWFGYLISSPKVTWNEFPMTSKLLDRNIRFRLVMPISESDRIIKTESGVDALMDKYDEQKRELFTFKKQS